MEEKESQEIAISQNTSPAQFQKNEIQLIKDTCCPDATDLELKLFLNACQQTGLNPLLKQIHAVKRYNSSLKKEVMAVQVGIDGYRLIAERSGKYAPGRDTSYQYDKNGNLLSATAYVKKLTPDGTWHEVGCTAFYDEKVQTYFDKNTKKKEVIGVWKEIPRTMLAKAAEVQALKRCFPNEISYIQSVNENLQEAPARVEGVVNHPVSKTQLKNLLTAIGSNKDLLEKICTHYKIAGLGELSESQYHEVMNRVAAEN